VARVIRGGVLGLAEAELYKGAEPQSGEPGVNNGRN
jgi:hypothetical protein